MTSFAKNNILELLKANLALYKSEFFPTTIEDLYESVKKVVDNWDELISPADDYPTPTLAYVVNYKNDYVNRKVAYFRTRSEAVEFIGHKYNDFKPYTNPFAPEELTLSWENLNKHAVVFITTEWTD